MKVEIKKDCVVLIPESQYDQYSIGVISTKLSNSVQSTVGSDPKINEMIIPKQELVKFLHASTVRNRT